MFRDRTKKRFHSSIGPTLQTKSRGDPNQPFLPIDSVCTDHPAIMPGSLPAKPLRHPTLTVCSRPGVDQTALSNPAAAGGLKGPGARFTVCRRFKGSP